LRDITKKKMSGGRTSGVLSPNPTNQSVEKVLLEVSSTASDARLKFELPNIAEDDIVLVENVLKAVQSLGTEDSPLCVKYKVKVISTGYMLISSFSAVDVYEVDLDDLLFIKSISPSRIDSVCIARTAAQGLSELIVKILDHKQRIMVTRSTSFSATRKRKWSSV
jgi:hypothetical protein